MISIPDMALLGAAALMFFGPEQLPRVARKAGAVMREIQNTSQSFIRELERAADVQDAGERKPYEAPPYEPVPYDAAAYDAETVHTNGTGGLDYEPYEPDPVPPASEKFAEPRPAINRESAYEYGAEPFDPPPPPR